MRAAWAAVALLAPIATQAQTVDCRAWDANGNGVVESADAAPLIAEAATLSACLAKDYAAAERCQPLDLDLDGRLDGEDALEAWDRYARLLGCLGRRVVDAPECANVDADRDGILSTGDFAPLAIFFERQRSCEGVDLSLIACRSVDYDGDAFVSTNELPVLLQRFATFQTCLGTRDLEPDGLWIDRDRLRARPTSGPGWEAVLREANAPFLWPNLANQDDPANTRTLAKALVAVRLDREDLRTEVIRALRSLVFDGSEAGAETLAIGREVAAYVFAADLIDLPRLDPGLDGAFRARLRDLRDRDFAGRSLVSTHAERPNNWGTHAGASRIAIDLYLGDEADLAAAAAVHRAWLGEGPAHAGFRYGATWWQPEPGRPVAIGPRGARIGDVDLDGALPEELRRGGPLADPPVHTGYVWEALQGAVVTTELLARHGYPDAWRWGDDALLRALAWLERADARFGSWWATGDDPWIVWLVNRATASRFPAPIGGRAGKNLGFTEWTHAPD